MKNPNNNLMGFKALLIMIAIVLTSLCCMSNAHTSEKKKEIIVYSKCSSNEAANDLEYSITQIKDKLIKNHISIRRDTTQKKCGYMLIYGEKKKIITMVLTDLELSEEIDKFYK